MGGRRKNKPEKQAEAPEQNGERKPVNAHLFTGYRDVQVKLGEKGLLDVMHDQQTICAEIRECEIMQAGKEEQIAEAEGTLAVRRRELRDIEEQKETHGQRLRDSVEAHSKGYRIVRELVEEVFLNGEVITYRKGTKDELSRRNATAEEWDAAQSLKDHEGRVINRFAKGTPIPGKPGLVILEGGKEVEAVDDAGHAYIGPQHDPTKPAPKQKEQKKRGRPPKDKDKKPIPFSAQNDDDDKKDEDGGSW